MHLSEVRRDGNVIMKDAHPWTATVHSLLNHLRDVGFDASPAVVGTGFDGLGRETISYMPGTIMTTGQWTCHGAREVGRMLRRLHEATQSFVPAQEAVWRPWFGRRVGGPRKIIGHCDAAPWNIVARDGLPIALIDWDLAGPVDPMIDLAQACWLNAQLHDDVVAMRERLASAEDRAVLLRAIADGYGLPRRQRRGLVDLMIVFAMHSVASEADDAGVLPEVPLSSYDRELPWAMAWRARAAVWMGTHKTLLQDAMG